MYIYWNLQFYMIFNKYNSSAPPVNNKNAE